LDLRRKFILKKSLAQFSSHETIRASSVVWMSMNLPDGKIKKDPARVRARSFLFIASMKKQKSCLFYFHVIPGINRTSGVSKKNGGGIRTRA
jgi:hypothetical protein